MSFCDHCEGQRFDRAQVLRATRKDLRSKNPRCKADDALRMAIDAVRGLEVPHLERLDEVSEDEVIH